MKSPRTFHAPRQTTTIIHSTSPPATLYIYFRFLNYIRYSYSFSIETNHNVIVVVRKFEKDTRRSAKFEFGDEDETRVRTKSVNVEIYCNKTSMVYKEYRVSRGNSNRYEYINCLIFVKLKSNILPRQYLYYCLSIKCSPQALFC